MAKNSNFKNQKLLTNPHILKLFEAELIHIKNLDNALKTLIGDLNNYKAELLTASKSNEFMDLNLAFAIHEKCCAILKFVERSEDPELNNYLMAAVSYFIRADDATNDLKTLDGFDDDLEVIKAVLNQFNLNEIINSEIEKKKSKGAS